MTQYENSSAPEEFQENLDGAVAEAVAPVPPAAPTDKPEDVVPVKEQIAYGIGAFMDGGGVALMSCIMLNYMTDALGLVAATASTIMMAAKMWDAVTDPLMGMISDNTRSSKGRRKPYMFWGGISLVFAIFLLFAPITEWGIARGSGAAIAYILIMYLIWNTCSTITQVPYCSMASDISPSFKQRNNANTVKLVFAAVASGLAYVVPLVLLEAYTEGGAFGIVPAITATQFWLILCSLFGVLFGGGLIICSIFVKERIRHPLYGIKREKKKLTAEDVKNSVKAFLKSYVRPFKNKSYTLHIVMYASAFACMDMLSALAVYYATDVWRGSQLFGMNFSSLFIIAPLMVAAVLAFPIVRIMLDKKSKAFAFRMGLPLYVVGAILLGVLNPSMNVHPVIMPIAALIMGLGFGGAQMIPWMNFPDTLDVAELATGERPTGNYSGMMTLTRKLAGALGVGVVGWVLTGIGYDQYSTELDALREGMGSEAFSQQVTATNLLDFGIDASGTLLGIRILLAVAVCVLITVAFVGSLRFKLNNKKLARIRYFVDNVKNGEYDTLTDEEKAERIALIKQLYGKYDEEADRRLVSGEKADVEII